MGWACFPTPPPLGAPSTCAAVIQAVESGHQAAVVFVVQRDDCDSFAPHDTADPEFGITLREGVKAGVEAFGLQVPGHRDPGHSGPQPTHPAVTGLRYQCPVKPESPRTPQGPDQVIETLGPLLEDVYQRLYRAYGPQGWWPGDGPLDVVIGAILTQSAAWANVERAIARLKEADCWSLEAIHQRPVDELAQIVRSSGYFNAKARKPQSLCGPWWRTIMLAASRNSWAKTRHSYGRSCYPSTASVPKPRMT